MFSMSVTDMAHHQFTDALCKNLSQGSPFGNTRLADIKQYDIKTMDKSKITFQTGYVDPRGDLATLVSTSSALSRCPDNIQSLRRCNSLGRTQVGRLAPEPGTDSGVSGLSEIIPINI